jgi:hypothetical protein
MKHVTLQKIVAHGFWYDPRTWLCGETTYRPTKKTEDDTCAKAQVDLPLSVQAFPYFTAAMDCAYATEFPATV